MSPWMFQDREKESKFREHFFLTLLDRYRLLIRSCLAGIWVLNAAAALTLILFDNGDTGQYIGIAARMVGIIAGSYLHCTKWSDEFKPVIAKGFMWINRTFNCLASSVEAGLSQPDSQLKVGLLVQMYFGSVLLPTYEEALLSSVVMSYTELSRLLIIGGPCPTDSTRSCTGHELWERFVHHTLYLCIAAWIHYHTHSDRRRDFSRRLRRAARDGAQREGTPAADGVDGERRAPRASEDSDAQAARPRVAEHVPPPSSPAGELAKVDSEGDLDAGPGTGAAPAATDEAAALGLLCLAVRALHELPPPSPSLSLDLTSSLLPLPPKATGRRGWRER